MENRPKIADIGALVASRGKLLKIAKDLGVSRNTLHRWIAENSFPKDKAVVVGAMWGLPYWRLHDPWAGTELAFDVGWEPAAPEPEEADGEPAPKPVGRPSSRPAKESPPPTLTEDGQPTPGYVYTVRGLKIPIREGARWIPFPTEKDGDWPRAFTWFDGRRAVMSTTATGVPVYVEEATGQKLTENGYRQYPAVQGIMRSLAENGDDPNGNTVRWEGA